MIDFYNVFRLFGSAALMTTLAACAAPASSPAPAAPSAAESPATLQSLIGDARCSGDAQCRTIAVGAKACGGPESYLAWSAAQTDEAALNAAAERHAAERRKGSAASGRMSTCSLVVDPGAACTAGRCTLRGR